MMNWKLVAIPVIGYILGAIPFSYAITRWKTGGDIREMGSRNVGATNVLRTSGKVAGLAALVLDVLKGIIAVVIGKLIGGTEFWGACAGFCSIVGHSFPVFLRFRGGRSVATGAGSFLVLCPFGILSAIGVFIIMLYSFRIVSLSSIVASASFPVFAWIYGESKGVILWGAISAGWIILRHWENLVRLLHGTERKMGARKSA
jgi:glycerol-3-phosphate acyltransferase PlsY